MNVDPLKKKKPSSSLLLQADLSSANDKLQLTEARVGHAMARLQELMDEANVMGLGDEAAEAASEAAALLAPPLPAAPSPSSAAAAAPAVHPQAAEQLHQQQLPPGYRSQNTNRFRKRKLADAGSLRTAHPESGLRNFWFPVAFLSAAKKAADAGRPVTFPLFSEDWQLSASAANGGWVAKNLGLRGPAAMPVAVRDGFVWVFPGALPPGGPDAASSAPGEFGLPPLPTQFAKPNGYTIHAEITVEDLPIEHGLLVENLLDLAHAPFTHQGTFAKGWGVPSVVNFVTRQLRKAGDGWNDMPRFLAGAPGVRGHWKPYPIDMSFEAPCMTLSHIGMVKPGQPVSGDNVQAGDCERHLHQLHVCLPAKEGRTRLLYRMCLDFAPWAKALPFMPAVWREMARQVLGEDLRLVEGQQAALLRGSSVWNVPVAYDKIGLLYRRWRNLVDVPGGAPCATHWAERLSGSGHGHRAAADLGAAGAVAASAAAGSTATLTRSG